MNLKQPSLKRARVRAKEAFNLYIRLRDTHDGWGNCISCGANKPFDELDAGHFMKATRAYTEFEERNVNIQCRKCNRFQNGNEGHYAVALDKKYGEGTAAEIVELSHHQKERTVEELLEIERKYKDAASQLTS